MRLEPAGAAWPAALEVLLLGRVEAALLLFAGNGADRSGAALPSIFAIAALAAIRTGRWPKNGSVSSDWPTTKTNTIEIGHRDKPTSRKTIAVPNEPHTWAMR